MFLLPQASTSEPVEGQSDDHPIVLSHDTAEEFEALLDMIYAKEYALPNTGDLTWLKRLAAASRWEAPILRSTAMEGLSRSKKTA
jgi:hypothetical protein